MGMIDDGGPAFPTEDGTRFYKGMSLRDWFAGQALAGLMSNDDFVGRNRSDAIAKAAFIVADAMLAVRTRHQP